MSKYVSETAAAKSLRVVVIMKGSRHVATIRAHFGNSRVLVNVFQDSKAQLASAKTRKTDTESRAAHDAYGFQYASATGYGYDKYSAALAGLIIDGHEMTDHCQGKIKPPRGLKLFPREFKAPKGYSLANWNQRRVQNDDGTWRYEGEEGYSDCYRKTGTDFLRDIGYTILQVG